MKKLLAILLTLALMLPLYGLAEETAPQATLTTITLSEFHPSALVGDLLDDATDSVIQDLMDVLGIVIYQSPDGQMVSYDVQLGGQSVLDLSLQQEDAQYYVGGGIIGGTVTFNADEDLPTIAKLMYADELANRGKTADEIAQKLEEANSSELSSCEATARTYYEVIQMILQTRRMHPTKLMNLVEQGIDEAAWAERIGQALPDMVREPVAEQPDNCDPAATVVTVTLAHEQLLNFVYSVAEMVLEDPDLGAVAQTAYLNVQPLTEVFTNGEQQEGDTPLMALLRVLLSTVEEVQATAYLDENDAIVKMTVQVENRSTTGDEAAPLTVEAFTLVRNTTADGTHYQLAQERENGQDTWNVSLSTGRMTMDYVGESGESRSEQHYQVQVSEVENGKHLLLTLRQSMAYSAAEASKSEMALTVNYDDLLLDGERHQRTNLTYAYNGQTAVALTIETRPCEVRPLLSESEGIYDLGDMSNAQYAAFNQLVTANVMLTASKVMSNLPASVLVLLNGTGSEGGVTE